MRVHCVQHISFEDPGAIVEWVRVRGHDLTIVNIEAGHRLPGPTESDFLIVLGGPMSVHDRDEHLWMRDEMQRISDFIKSQKPVLGICLGAQMIATILGAMVTRNVHREIGWYDVHFKRSTVKTFHWHSEVFGRPPGSVKVASSDLTKCQGFRVGQKVMGLQFHPEVTEASVLKMIEHCGHEIQDGVIGEQSAADIIAQAPEACAGHRALLYRILDSLVSS